MSEQEKRVGLNEAVFREVNERIAELSEQAAIEQSLDLVCECGDADCKERISMTRAEYEEVRSDARQFAVYPGHRYANVEEVVARRHGYDVVRKREGEAAEIAENSDSRS